MAMRKLTLSLLTFAAFGLALPAAALTATQSVETEKVVVQADGTEMTQRTIADKVKPGDRVVYVLNVENNDAEPASNLVLTMPVPDEIRYIEGSSSKPGAVVTFSVDGGASFKDRATLEVQEMDGTVRKADASDISHIRWKVAGPLPVGSSDEIAFKGILK